MLSLDTNVIVYAFDARDAAKRVTALHVLGAAPTVGAQIGLQVIGETQNALMRRLKMDKSKVVPIVRDLLVRFGTFGYLRSNVLSAIDDLALGRLSYWDGLLVSSAAAAGCQTFLSEDMQDGAAFGGLTVVNPFAANGTLSAGAAAALAP